MNYTLKLNIDWLEVANQRIWIDGKWVQKIPKLQIRKLMLHLRGLKIVKKTRNYIYYTEK